MDYPVIYAKSDGQTLEAHTKQCLALLADYRCNHPSLLQERQWQLLSYALRFHDIGKIDQQFQQMVRGDKRNLDRLIPHGYLSVMLLDKDFFTGTLGWSMEEFALLAMLIYHHHARKTVDIEWQNQYCKEQFYPRCAALQLPSGNGLMTLPKKQNQYARVSKLVTESQRNTYLLMKGILNRMDYCASAGRDSVEQPTRFQGRTVGDCALQALTDKGYALRPVQRFLQAHQGENLLVQASTGVGKTEGALLWMGEKKGFYTLPLKVSIFAIYHRIHNQNAIAYSPAVMLHGDAKAYYLTQENEESDRYQAARLFAAPLTVCTVDQLFRFVYKINGTEIGAAVLADSCLVVDEIQMYEPTLLGSILYALYLVTQLGGHFLILTATFPKLLERHMKALNIPYHRRPQNEFGEISRRHRMALLADNMEFPIETLCQQGQCQRVLVICNTVRRAVHVYQSIQAQGTDCHLLHSRFLRKDRRKLEAEILRFAPNDPNRAHACGIWVTTQIVEASLDLDFDVLYTELCSVDSLLQRMGRVYRSRWYDLGKTPNVWVLDNENTGMGRVIDPELYQYSKAVVAQYDGCLLEESQQQDDKTAMMDAVFDETKNPAILHSSYQKKIEDQIALLRHLPLYQNENPQSFRDIESLTVIPEPVYRQLQADGTLDNLKRQLKSPDPVCRTKAQEALRDETVSIGAYLVPKRFDCNVGWPHSGIVCCAGSYDFNEDSCTGIGLTLARKDAFRKQAEGMFL